MRNALSLSMCDSILQCAHDISQSSSNVRALVLTGDSNCFSAGKDLKASALHTESEAAEYYLRTLSVVKALLAVPIPVIVSMEKTCLGLGLELALTADIRIAGESTNLGFPEINLNLFPGCGGAVLLPLILGNVHLASDLILTGRRVSAKEALALNLVSRVVPDGQALDRALSIAEPLVAKNRDLLVRTKQVVTYGFKSQLRDWMTLSETNRRIVGQSKEHLSSLKEWTK